MKKNFINFSISLWENKPSKSINVPSFMLNDKPIDIVDIYEGDGFVVETKIQSKGIIDFELPKDKPYRDLTRYHIFYN